MAAEAEKIAGQKDTHTIQPTENRPGIANMNDCDSGSQGALTSFHILKMLEAAASRRSVNIVLVDEKTDSDKVTEAPKKDMENVSLVLEVSE